MPLPPAPSPHLLRPPPRRPLSFQTTLPQPSFSLPSSDPRAAPPQIQPLHVAAAIGSSSWRPLTLPRHASNLRAHLRRRCRIPCPWHGSCWAVVRELRLPRGHRRRQRWRRAVVSRCFCRHAHVEGQEVGWNV